MRARIGIRGRVRKCKSALKLCECIITASLYCGATLIFSPHLQCEKYLHDSFIRSPFVCSHFFLQFLVVYPEQFTVKTCMSPPLGESVVHFPKVFRKKYQTRKHSSRMHTAHSLPYRETETPLTKTSPVNRITDGCENITFPKLSCWAVKIA